ncbi:SP2 protein [Salpingoeca rosetta]|uniref:SP2 protein n=1 Tax=Salpingoeca rosetta (strain ATCC 50818 / BSB-021) TaxID=946362 RepID=F2UE94_SALR5|nr:SP2 protein [Salpingoeca rosetta]EGD74944.1 SP2 protein [Salpingoeca rosetta]|eukprot:XP_004992589.1 SP2 protein [Salpingoeca rosetta]
MRSVLLIGVVLAVAVAAGAAVAVGAEQAGEDTLPQTAFTAEDLKKYDGRDPELPILISLKGIVYDVTAGKRFYGPGASYNALVGKDSTRAVGLWSLDEKDLTDDISDFTEEQLAGLNEVIETVYKAKYPVVGRFVKTHDEL